MRAIQKEQFATCIGTYERLVFAICLSFTKNQFDAEDLAQETFLAALRAFDRFDGENMKAWLAAIAANKCRDFLSRADRKNLPLPEEDAELVADSRGSPEEKLLDSFSNERVHKLCGMLKEPYKSVAVGYFIKNEKLSETAKQTGQSLRTLETQLYRAKKLLKALWEEETS